MLCPRCGKSNDISAKVCSDCGYDPSRDGLTAPHPKAKGRVSKVRLIINILVCCFIAYTAYIAMTTRGNYVTRLQVYEAMETGESAAETIDRYYHQHQSMPDNLATAGFTEKLPASVKAIAIDPQSGTVSITVAGAQDTHPIIDGKKLLLTPTIEKNYPWVWYCTSKDIPAAYLSHQCNSSKPPIPIMIGVKASPAKPASGAVSCYKIKNC